MDKIERKLQKVIYAFAMSVIIIVAAFAVTIYYYETKEISKGAAEEGLFAMAFVDENVGSVPLNVSFSSLLFNLEGDPTYHWDFGDGNTSNEKNPTYKYTEDGEYTCNLTITDGAGEKVTTSVKVLAVVNKAPTVVALVDPTASRRPNRPFLLSQFLEKLPITLSHPIFVAFLKTSSPLKMEEGWITCDAQWNDPEGGEIVWYEWVLTQPTVYYMGGRQDWPKFNFSDENLSTITLPLLYTFRTGQYDIRVTVTDDAGNKASDIKRFNVGISSIEGQINSLKMKWDELWGPNFQFQKPFVKDTIHPLLWKVLIGPAHNLTDNMIEKILAPLPPDTRDTVYNLYYTLVWDKTDKNYHRPNWNPPSIPSDPSPADNATNVSISTNLSWNCSDPDGDGIRYDIYFGAALPPSLVALDQTGTTYSFISSMQSNTTYYWNIVAKDKPATGGSKTTYGPLWSFTTT